MRYLFLLLLVTGLACCNKDLLNTSSRSDIWVPTSLQDFQDLLNNYSIMNQHPQADEESADDYFISDQFWQFSPKNYLINAYTWKPVLFIGNQENKDWSNSYTQVLYANATLEGLKKAGDSTTNKQQWTTLKGSALFFRAFAFYNLAKNFSPAYDKNSANNDLGIPLKLSADINEKIVRSTVQQTYNQILSDLLEAAPLLPIKAPPLNKSRPSKVAVFSLLARVTLYMREYEQAATYCDSALRLCDSLVNFNQLNTTTPNPFANGNKEIIFHSQMMQDNNIFTSMVYPGVIVAPELYRIYDNNDLRKQIFYQEAFGNIYLKGSFLGNAIPFTGLASDELFLIRAECYARSGNIIAAINMLNTLLLNRYKTGTFIPRQAASAAEALDTILLERRKELAFRGIRWSDLKRLNKENRQIILQRTVNGNTFTLLPNSPLYVLPIPPEEIALSGIQQNQR